METIVLFIPQLYLLMSCIIMVWAGLLCVRYTNIIKINLSHEHVVKVDNVLDWLLMATLCITQVVLIFILSPWIMLMMDALGAINVLSMAYLSYVTWENKDILSGTSK